MAFYYHEPQPRYSIAILTMEDEHRPFRGNHQNFIDLIRTGRDMGVFVYVTRVSDLKLGEKRINGFIYRPETNTWVQAMLPFPHVIYNRIPTRKDEQAPEVQRKIQACLKHSRISLFNPCFFSKWFLFEALNKSKATRKYVPATKKLTNMSDLEGMLARFPLVYLKPIRGKAGVGIMRIERPKTKKGSYTLKVQVLKRSKVFSYPTIKQLWHAVSKLTASEDYLVQQGIPLAVTEGRPFDLRVLVQKNHRGEWSLTGIGARVAGRYSITTHVPRGGRIDDPQKALASAFGAETAKATLKRVQQTALLIARQIEKASGYKLGEMSMDLGVDTTGQIWFFEANSRPMKFDEPDIRKKSLERIIQYSLYLIKSRKRSR